RPARTPATTASASRSATPRRCLAAPWNAQPATTTRPGRPRGARRPASGGVSGGVCRASGVLYPGRRCPSPTVRANFRPMPLLHLAIAQFRPRKGDVQGNIRRVGEVLAQAAALDPRPHVVQFPETTTSGYFVEGGVRENALTADELAAALTAAYQGPPIDAVIGFYEKHEGDLHNSLAYVRCGGTAEIVHIHRKTFLPTYGLFDEERFVERGYSIRAFDAPWGRASMLVCEDAWHSLTGLIAALDGAHVVFVSSASPARGAFERVDGASIPGSVARW